MSDGWPERDRFEKADQDLELARRALGPGQPLRGMACYHAQQCAEKYLKGYLIAHSVPFRFVHDLVYLTQLCATQEPAFEQLMSAAEILASMGRYCAIRWKARKSPMWMQPGRPSGWPNKLLLQSCGVRQKRSTLEAPMRISERGQITIPKPLRDLFGMNSKVEVEITPTENGVLIQKRTAGNIPWIASMESSLGAVAPTTTSRRYEAGDFGIRME